MTQEHWEVIEGFPIYSISDHGRVRNDNTGKILSKHSNQQGIVAVGLFDGAEQHKRSVTLLVAHAFLDEPSNPLFDTPINVDGDRLNNHVDNLMWRPRWFAGRYHRQFKPGQPKGFDAPVVDMDSGIKYQNSLSAATTFGLLNAEVAYSVINGSYCFPTYQYFREWRP